MPDMFYVHRNGRAKVYELRAGVVQGRRVFTVPLARGRRLTIEGDRAETVIPQLRVLFERGVLGE